MTCEQFLATRAWHDNIEAVNPNATGAREGYGYLNNEVWIEVRNWGDPASPAKRTWYLRIANCEWESTDITELEHRLYNWAVAEGYEIP
jgi:hypothetical protein